MSVHVVRIWLEDRPGALGAVASRIGAVKGDLIGIDILERGAGRAIDELVVELPSPDLVPLLVRELSEVDGVDVEDVRPLGPQPLDPRLDALDTAIVLVEAPTVERLLQLLTEEAAKDFEADWATVVDHRSSGALATTGKAPTAEWTRAFLAGSSASVLVADGLGAPDDVAWASLSAAELTLLMGRSGRPFRARERRQATSLARIADARWTEMVLHRRR
jgi:hypothetical protein